MAVLRTRPAAAAKTTTLPWLAVAALHSNAADNPRNQSITAALLVHALPSQTYHTVYATLGARDAVMRARAPWACEGAQHAPAR